MAVRVLNINSSFMYLYVNTWAHTVLKRQLGALHPSARSCGHCWQHRLWLLFLCLNSDHDSFVREGEGNASGQVIDEGFGGALTVSGGCMCEISHKETGPLSHHI